VSRSLAVGIEEERNRMKSAASDLDHRAHATNISDAEMTALAFQIGFQQRWRERVVG